MTTNDEEKYECQVCGNCFSSKKGRGIHFGHHTDTEKNTTLIDELNRLANELEKTPTGSEMNKHGRFSNGTYKNLFDSWNDALCEAGLSVNRETNISSERLIDELNRLANELEKTPTRRKMNKHGGFSVNTYRNRFGSWNDALCEAGLSVNSEMNISSEQLIDELNRLANELEKTPTIHEMNKHGKFTYEPYASRFGSWNDALCEVGLSVNYERNISSERLIDELNRLANELEKTPTAHEMDKHGEFSCKPYIERFGSWNDALCKADIEQTSINHPERLDHLVRSSWETKIADLLVDNSIDYEYESLTIDYGDGRTYTPDFITDDYVIEVKGRIYSNEAQKARAALDVLDHKEYVVIGSEKACNVLPADHHIHWDERECILSLFETVAKPAPASATAD